MPGLPGPRNPITVARLGVGLMRRPYPVLLELHERYGPVSAIGWGPTRVVFLLGRDANEYVLSTNAENFRWGEAFEMLRIVDGDTALVVTDGDDHRRRRRLVQPAFHLHRINGYLDVILDEVDRTIDGWAPGATVDAWGEYRRTVRRIVARALFGGTMGAAADELGDALPPGIDWVNRPLPLQVKFGRGWRRAVEGRRRADELLFAEIARRRALGGGDTRDDADPADMLDELLAVRDEDGDRLSDEEVADQVRSLIAAGFDTTSAAVAWAVWALLAHPGVEERLRAEIGDVLGDHALTAADVARLKWLDAFVSEVLRLWGPAAVGPRHAVDAFDFAGHTVPAGSLVLYSQYVTHRMPEYWDEPLSFRPERWFAPDVAPPYAYLPFGGGYRRCIGFALALLEIKAVLVALLRRTRLSLVPGQRIEPTGVAAMYPRFGVKVRVDEVRPAFLSPEPTATVSFRDKNGGVTGARPG